MKVPASFGGPIYALRTDIDFVRPACGTEEGFEPNEEPADRGRDRQ